MLPDSLFFPIFSVFRFVKKPTAEGIGPTRLFEWISNDIKFVMFLIEVGSDPTRRFEYAEKVVTATREYPRSWGKAEKQLENSTKYFRLAKQP